MSTPETLTRELAALDDALAGRPVDPDLADLAELAVLVRDERPVPDPAFTRSLDSRVERGFPRDAPQARAPLQLAEAHAARARLRRLGAARRRARHGDPAERRRRRTPAAPAPAAATRARVRRRQSGGIVRAARKQSAPSAAEDSAAAAPRRPTRRDRRPAVPPGTPSARRTPTAAPAATSSAPRRSCSPRPRARSTARRAKILAVTDDLGGYVVTSQVTSGSSGEFELRVPERRLQRALSRLSGSRQGARAHPELAGHHRRGRLRPGAAEGRPHRAPQPAAPARRRPRR